MTRAILDAERDEAVRLAEEVIAKLDVVERLRYFGEMQERGSPYVSIDLRLKSVADKMEKIARALLAAEADARRYRWNRGHPDWADENFLGSLSPEEYDAAIDREMANVIEGTK